jgi:hypothetical protein
MNLKLRRLVRTPYSEQYALFDLDRTDSNYDPMSVGKLDLHYAAEGIYGTFLLWKASIAGMPTDQIDALVQATVQELSEPMGLPVFYAIEFFSTDLESYVLHSNEDADEGESDKDQA